MRETGLLVALVPRPDPDPEAKRDRAHGWHCLADHAHARRERAELRSFGHLAIAPAVAATATSAVATPAAFPTRPPVASADARQVLDRLALDLGIVRQA